MFLLNSVKSFVLIQSGNAFHCLAAKYEKELRPKLVVLGLQRPYLLPIMPVWHIGQQAYKGTKCYTYIFIYSFVHIYSFLLMLFIYSFAKHISLF